MLVIALLILPIGMIVIGNGACKHILSAEVIILLLVFYQDQ